MASAQKPNVPQNGFTLTELLVAIFIFALMTAASTGILNLALQSSDAVGAQTDAIARLTVSRALIKADLAQVIARPTRGRFGTQLGQGFIGGTATERDSLLLSFARLGWLNPGGSLPRGSTQAVDYVLENNQLIRRHPLRTDPAPETIFHDRVLFTDVAAARVEFNAQGTWQPSWRTGDFTSASLPGAMRLILEFNDGSSMTQLFLITGERL